MDLPKIKKELLYPTKNKSLQECNLMGPLNFDENQVSIVDLLPDLIHISPIVVIDFSMANLTF